MQFLCLWCCVPSDSVVHINSFFSLVLFSAVIHKRRGKKLICKTIKYKLDSSSKMQFVFFYPKDIQTFFWKTINFVENLGMTRSRGRGGSSCSLRHYDAMGTKIDMGFTFYISVLLDVHGDHIAKGNRPIFDLPLFFRNLLKHSCFCWHETIFRAASYCFCGHQITFCATSNFFSDTKLFFVHYQFFILDIV